MKPTSLTRRSILKSATAAAVLSMTRTSAQAASSGPAKYPIRLNWQPNTSEVWVTPAGVLFYKTMNQKPEKNDRAISMCSSELDFSL